MRKFVQKLAPSPRQLLNRQRLQKIFGLQKFEVRFGSWSVESFCGRDTEVCEQLRKRKIDMCCLQQRRWSGQGAPFVDIKRKSYKLCASLEIMIEQEMLEF